jgi:two-component system LytT family response regulator
MSLIAADEYPPMRTLIVDHEPRGRAMLRQLCEADASICEVTEAECGATALQMIAANRPDLLFLDVELKDMTGFDVLRSLNGARRPAVVMVAPHENLAIEAYRGGAIDYLTKPVDAHHVARAIEIVHRRCDSSLPREQGNFTARSSHTSQSPRSQLHLMAEHAHRLYFLAIEDIDFIESCGNYVLIHVGDQKYVRRDTLKRLAATLRNLGFEWIRRSTLINLSRVAFAEKVGRGALAFTLVTGTRLISRARIRLKETRASGGELQP